MYYLIQQLISHLFSKPESLVSIVTPFCSVALRGISLLFCLIRLGDNEITNFADPLGRAQLVNTQLLSPTLLMVSYTTVNKPKPYTVKRFCSILSPSPTATRSWWISHSLTARWPRPASSSAGPIRLERLSLPVGGPRLTTLSWPPRSITWSW